MELYIIKSTSVWTINGNKEVISFLEALHQWASLASFGDNVITDESQWNKVFEDCHPEAVKAFRNYLLAVMRDNVLDRLIFTVNAFKYQPEANGLLYYEKPVGNPADMSAILGCFNRILNQDEFILSYVIFYPEEDDGTAAEYLTVTVYKDGVRVTGCYNSILDYYKALFL